MQRWEIQGWLSGSPPFQGSWLDQWLPAWLSDRVIEQVLKTYRWPLPRPAEYDSLGMGPRHHFILLRYFFKLCALTCMWNLKKKKPGSQSERRDWRLPVAEGVGVGETGKRSEGTDLSDKEVLGMWHGVVTVLMELSWGFPGGASDKNPPANAGGVGSTPGLGRPHVLQSS